MKCPYCDHPDTKVLDSRDSEDNETTRRRRECLSCNKRFTTYERVEMIDLTIVKKDGRREKFDRNKLLNGIRKACEKRPISLEVIERMVDDIETELRNMNSIEINSNVIGERVMEKLKKTDHIAYIRFASVYRSFADILSFEKELKMLKQSEGA